MAKHHCRGALVATLCAGLVLHSPAAHASRLWMPDREPHLGAAAAPDSDAPDQPLLNIPGCQRFTNVCIDQSTFIFYDEQYNWQSPNYVEPPRLDVEDVAAQAQTEGDSNTDADPRPHQILHHVFRSRARTASEASPELQQPSFSKKTVPVVLYSQYMYNICELMRYTMWQVYNWHDGGSIGENVSFVMSTPGGQGLHGNHEITVGAYSRYGVTTLADFSRRAVPGVRVDYTAEGTMQQCYAQVHVCKLMRAEAQHIFDVGQHVVARWAPSIPRNPLGFSDEPRVLKVVIGARHGGVRTILNLQELLESCARARPPAGWTRIECRVYSFGPVQPVPKDLVFRNIGVIQSANVLVYIHGSEGANAFYARPGTAALELRPCGFGTAMRVWAELFYPTIHRENGDEIRFFGLNVEDPTACTPGEHEQRHLNGGAAFMGHTYVRDRHVTLPPNIFIESLGYVAAYVDEPVSRFRPVREAKKNIALFTDGKLTWGAE